MKYTTAKQKLDDMFADKTVKLCSVSDSLIMIAR